MQCNWCVCAELGWKKNIWLEFHLNLDLKLTRLKRENTMNYWLKINKKNLNENLFLSLFFHLELAFTWPWLFIFFAYLWFFRFFGNFDESSVNFPVIFPPATSANIDGIFHARIRKLFSQIQEKILLFFEHKKQRKFFFLAREFIIFTQSKFSWFLGWDFYKAGLSSLDTYCNFHNANGKGNFNFPRNFSIVFFAFKSRL